MDRRTTADPPDEHWWTPRQREAPMVLLHGFTGSGLSWHAVVPFVHAARPNVPIVSMHLPGHHPHVPVIPGSFSDTVRAIGDAWTQRQYNNIHLVGYSLGARIALGLLIAYPRLFRRATLIGVHPGLATAEQRDVRRHSDTQWAQLLRDRGMAVFLEAWERQSLFKSQSAAEPALLEHQRDVRMHHNAHALADALDVLSLANMPNFQLVVGHLRVPTTLVAGAEDERFVDLANQLQASWEMARCVVIEGCGHNPLVDAPRSLAKILVRADDDEPITEP